MKFLFESSLFSLSLRSHQLHRVSEIWWCSLLRESRSETHRAKAAFVYVVPNSGFLSPADRQEHQVAVECRCARNFLVVAHVNNDGNSDILCFSIGPAFQEPRRSSSKTRRHVNCNDFSQITSVKERMSECHKPAGFGNLLWFCKLTSRLVNVLVHCVYCIEFHLITPEHTQCRHVLSCPHCNHRLSTVRLRRSRSLPPSSPNVTRLRQQARTHKRFDCPVYRSLNVNLKPLRHRSISQSLNQSVNPSPTHQHIEQAKSTSRSDRPAIHFACKTEHVPSWCGEGSAALRPKAPREVEMVPMPVRWPAVVSRYLGAVLQIVGSACGPRCCATDGRGLCLFQDWACCSLVLRSGRSGEGSAQVSLVRCSW